MINRKGCTLHNSRSRYSHGPRWNGALWSDALWEPCVQQNLLQAYQEPAFPGLSGASPGFHHLPCRSASFRVADSMWLLLHS